MALMVEEQLSSPKKSTLSLLEALAKGGSISSYKTEDGKIKIKILVKKQDLKQMLQSVNINNNHNRNNSSTSSIFPLLSFSAERQLHNLMKRKKKGSQAKEHKISHWRPVLHSIPEEY